MNTSQIGAVGSTLPQLSRGAKGPLTAQLQAALISLGFNQTSEGALTADGFFGPITETAVRNFQRSVGLLGMGVVESTTWAALAAKGKTFSLSPGDYGPSGPTTLAKAKPSQSSPIVSSVPVRPVWQTGLMVLGGLAAVGFALYFITEKTGGRVAGFDRLLGDGSPKLVGSGTTKPCKCRRTPSTSKLVEAEILEAA